MKKLSVSLLCITACSPAAYLTPGDAFDPAAVPAAPDYAALDSWAALPGVQDLADIAPAGDTDEQAAAAVDVFFVHPTTYLQKDGWNAPAHGVAVADELLDTEVIPGQASAFSGCCRVYAPRYRQATLGAYFAELDNQQPAFEVAYSDVERAFAHYLAEMNDGRPFIVASHSQGSMHAMRLLRTIDADPALRERFVAGYLVGYMLPMNLYDEVYEHLVPCSAPTQTGCIAAWDTYAEGAAPDVGSWVHWVGDELKQVAASHPTQCTNPVSWTDGTEQTLAADHKGAAEPRQEGAEPSLWTIARGRAAGAVVRQLHEPKPGLLQARCTERGLRVPSPRPDEGLRVIEFGKDNYHLHDYSFFYMDVRQNARDRAAAWLADRAEVAAE